MKRRLTRGVRQRFPLSALLFNLALEPMFEDLYRNLRFSFPAERRCIAKADDLTVFADEKDLTVLFARPNVFCKATQFAIQRSKCKLYQSNGISIQIFSVIPWQRE